LDNESLERNHLFGSNRGIVGLSAVRFKQTLFPRVVEALWRFGGGLVEVLRGKCHSSVAVFRAVATGSENTKLHTPHIPYAIRGLRLHFYIDLAQY
jgi:hypothetical protein